MNGNNSFDPDQRKDVKQEILELFRVDGVRSLLVLQVWARLRDRFALPEVNLAIRELIDTGEADLVGRRLHLN